MGGIEMIEKKKNNMDYLAMLHAKKYFLFCDLTVKKKTLIMKSLLKDKIIKNIYFNVDTNLNNTESINFIEMGINAINSQFFEQPREVDSIPYDWELWQHTCDEASIELVKWHQQEKERSEKLVLENNQKSMSMIDFHNNYMDTNNINPFPPFYLLQRQGIIPRLAISIEDLCIVLKANDGDESEIKELQELIDSNNSETKKRVILQNNKKYLDGVRKRPKSKRPLIYMQFYKDTWEENVEAIYQDIGIQTEFCEDAKKNINNQINNISQRIYEKYKKDLKSEALLKEPYASIARSIKLYEAEKIFKKEFVEHQHEKEIAYCDELIAQIASLIDKLGLLNHLDISRRKARLACFRANIN